MSPPALVSGGRRGGVAASEYTFPPLSRVLGDLALAPQTPVPVVGMISASDGTDKGLPGATWGRGKSRNLNL